MFIFITPFDVYIYIYIYILLLFFTPCGFLNSSCFLYSQRFICSTLRLFQLPCAVFANIAEIPNLTLNLNNTVGCRLFSFRRSYLGGYLVSTTFVIFTTIGNGTRD